MSFVKNLTTFIIFYYTIFFLNYLSAFSLKTCTNHQIPLPKTNNVYELWESTQPEIVRNDFSFRMDFKEKDLSTNPTVCQNIIKTLKRLKINITLNDLGTELGTYNSYGFPQIHWKLKDRNLKLLKVYIVPRFNPFNIRYIATNNFYTLEELSNQKSSISKIYTFWRL